MWLYIQLGSWAVLLELLFFIKHNKAKILFLGKFESALGTYMFFEEDPAPKTEDPLFDKLPEKNLKYICKSRKYLNMEHAYVTPKEGNYFLLLPDVT